jgi:uncharacterized protein YciW
MEVLITPTLRAAAIGPSHALAPILAARADIFEMTRAAENAVLTPNNPGGLSLGERAALACRMARLNAEPNLAAHFEERLAMTDLKDSSIADPSFDGGPSPRLQALLSHTDQVTQDPKSLTATDIDALKDADINEDDIVRLSQLIAFVNYQVRVSHGVRLMAAAS